jgi:hypothetical protein
VQYPHVIEQDGHMWIAFSQKKQTKLLRVSLDSIDAMLKE